MHHDGSKTTSARRDGRGHLSTDRHGLYPADFLHGDHHLRQGRSGRVESTVLQSTVRDMLRGADDRPVLVVTDEAVQAQKLLNVIDQCRLAGAKDVAVATEREAG